MTPLLQFEAVWERASHLSALHAYLVANVAPVFRSDELLRAEWAARVSALDLFIHELVAQQMLAIFERRRPSSPAYLRFRLSMETVQRISAAVTPTDASSAFDLDVRGQLGSMTFQDPEAIADAVRYCSPVELWNEVALHLGATQATKVREARALKGELSFVVQRRHKIVHEGDLQPSTPRIPWAITQADLASVSSVIERIVRAINVVVA